MFFVLGFFYVILFSYSYSVYSSGLWGSVQVLFELVHECTFWAYGGPVSFSLVVLSLFLVCSCAFFSYPLDLSVSRFYPFLLFLPFLLSRPMMPTEYLLCWYSCYALHLFRDAGPGTSSQR